MTQDLAFINEKIKEESLVDRADHGRDGQGHRRAEGAAGTDDDRAAGLGARPARGRARPGQDPGRQDAGAGHRPELQAHPVHPRPAAGRPDRHHGLQPEDRRIHHAQGADLHQPAAGRRDQPRPGQGAERAARGHAGAAGDHRRREPRHRPAVHGHGHPEPDRAGGDLPPARGPDRPLPAQGARSPTRRKARKRRSSSAWPAAATSRSSPC